MLREFAPAKVNLALHVTGQCEDGYHELDSLVVFASVGDKLSFREAPSLSLIVDGPEAAAVPTQSNSVLAAAHLLSPKGTAQITLTKNLPVAAGIGGGTADAAAAYRGLSKLWALPAPDASEQTFTRVAQLGSDVPVCLFSRAARMSGVGEKIELLPHLPELHAVLVNPRVEVQTPQVFNAVTDKNNAPMDVLPKSLPDGSSLIDWISHQRNDMQSAAISIAPVISEVLAAIDATPACQLARMSGSGATCFGLFPDSEAAWAAEAHILNSRPEWWVRSCTLGDQSAN